MSDFDEAVIQRIKQLEREVERLKRWERPIGGEGGVTDHGDLTGLLDDDHSQYLNNTRHDTTDRHTLGTVVPRDSTKADDTAVVHKSGDESVGGIKTFTSFPVTPSSAPTSDYQAANKKYVDDNAGSGGVTDHGWLTGLLDDDHTQYTKHPASSTDNAIVRWDGTGGRTLQNSSVAIDDNGKLSGDGLDGWIYDTDTWTYVSATSFKITGKDVRYRFPKGTKIKLVQSSTTKYFYVVATSYTSGNTIVTVTGGSDYALANATISGHAYSYAAAPQGFPLGTSTFVPLTTELMSTSWDGDSFSTTSKTLIDLSSVFGVPAGVKAVYVQMAIRDSASSTTDAWIVLGADKTAGRGINFGCGGLANDKWARHAAIVPCNTDGDIYYQINASGTSTFDVYLFIWGYWL